MSDDNSDGYSPADLKAMDEQTAREELTVDQYDRWEQLQDLLEEAAETEQHFEDQAETVADLTVRADPEALGTRVDVFGNSLLVRMNPENDQLLTGIQTLEDKYADVTPDTVGELDGEMTEALGDRMLEMLDAVLVKWGETKWDSLTEGQRQGILDDVRAQWQVDGLLKAWGIIGEATTANRDDNEDVVESFRGAQGRGPD